MWLINTATLELEEFFDETTRLKYAILSHRWGHEEVSMRDFQNKTSREALLGWKKIQAFCKHAAQNDLAYAWADTCCIDNTSSAGLSEAINSMWRWYEDSDVCYVYLQDVQQSHLSFKDDFEASSWWTRGWTLQELLAPTNVQFFDCDWSTIGSKVDMIPLISKITRITNFDNHRVASIAQRMSWASRRETTRAEDVAYCLMGLFDVNMPLLYGEGGPKAFQRLQEEILRRSNDESLFAWDGDGKKRSLFASSPADFANSSKISAEPSRKTYAMTNRGLEIEFEIKVSPIGEVYGPQIYEAKLACTNLNDPRHFPSIHLLFRDDAAACRIGPLHEGAGVLRGQTKTIYFPATSETGWKFYDGSYNLVGNVVAPHVQQGESHPHHTKSSLCPDWAYHVVREYWTSSFSALCALHDQASTRSQSLNFPKRQDNISQSFEQLQDKFLKGLDHEFKKRKRIQELDGE